MQNTGKSLQKHIADFSCMAEVIFHCLVDKEESIHNIAMDRLILLCTEHSKHSTIHSALVALLVVGWEGGRRGTKKGSKVGWR